jgi:hypothetical protein
MAMLKRYLMRVMMPGTEDDVADDFYSDTPFGAISVGDILDLEAVRRQMGVGKFRVTAVEHKLQNTGETSYHFICLFTEAVRPK